MPVIETGVKCGGCLMVLDESPALEVKHRVPCPLCGLLSRFHEVFISESVAATDYLTELLERDGEAIGFSTEGPDGRASSATLHNDSMLSLYLSGRPAQGEADSIAAYEILRERLNVDGGLWGRARRGEHVAADAILTDIDAPDVMLLVQVVRAAVQSQIWHRLCKCGSFTDELAIGGAADHLRVAIEHKMDKLVVDRSGWVLALDATQLAGLTFDGVVRRFHADHGNWAAGLGFAGIWLVGPQPRLTWRLDRSIS